jgi:hypothetical protein
VQAIAVLGGLPWLMGFFVMEHLILAPKLFVAMAACIFLVSRHLQTKNSVKV